MASELTRAIQTIRNFFAENYGARATINISIHETKEEKDNLQLLEIAEELQPLVGGDLVVDEAENTGWVTIHNWEKGQFEINFFYNRDTKKTRMWKDTLQEELR